MNHPALNDAAILAGRILLSAMFIVGGWGKIGGFAGAQAYMTAAGVPGALLPLVILTELGGGLLILFGWQTRLATVALGGFTIIATLLFHADWTQPMQHMIFMKNLAVAGGFAALFAAGAGRFSLDAYLGGSRSAKTAPALG